jgi:prepilin-type N-terminal cleavage/methylation domain-containing protein
MVGIARMRSSKAGFSLVEIMIVVVLAAIMFAALIPVFLSAEKGSSRDGVRVAEENIAQDRIEQVRLLPFTTITDSNLNVPSPQTFGDGLFGHVYTLAGNNQTYRIDYTVTPATKRTTVKVTVRRTDQTFATSMTTVIQDPAAAVVTTTSGSPTPTPSPSSTTGFYTITVSFKDYRDVKTSGTPKGVKVVRTDVTPNQTAAPSVQYPSSGSPKVAWAGLPGGPNISYIVTCVSQYGTFTTPNFHLLSDCPIYFDTNPGNQ